MTLFLIDGDAWGCMYAIVRAEDEFTAEQMVDKCNHWDFDNPDGSFELTADGPAAVLWVHSRSGPASD